MNAALLGLLIATPACSFVSCKDYDEDFNKVNARVDGLDQAKTKIDAELSSLKTQLAEATKKSEALQNSLGLYATKTDLTALSTSLATKDQLAKVQSELDAAVKLADANNKAALEKAQATINALLGQKVNTEAFEKLKAELQNAVNGKVSTAQLNDAVAALKNSLTNLSTKDNVDAKVRELSDKLTALLNGKLDKTELAELKQDVKAAAERIQKLEVAQATLTEALKGKASAEDLATAKRTLEAEVAKKATPQQLEELKTALTAEIAKLATKDELKNYATNESLKEYLKTSGLQGYAKEEFVKSEIEKLFEEKGRVATLTARLLALEEAKAKLDKVGGAADVNTVTDLKGTVEALGFSVQDLENKLDDKTKALNGRLSTLNRLVAIQATASEVFKKDIAALKGDENTDGSVKKQLKTVKDDLENKLSQLETRLYGDGVKGVTISQLNTKLAELHDQLVGAAGDAGKVKELNDKIVNLRGEVFTDATSLSSKLNALTARVNKIYDESEDTGEVQKIKELIANLRKEIYGGEGNTPEKEGKKVSLADQVNAINKNLNVLNVGQLTSLTAVPNEFVDGIQSFINYRYTFNELTLPAVNNEGVAEGTNGSEARTSTDVNFAEAEFQINPTSAHVEKDLKHYAFHEMVANTRGVNDAKVKPTHVDVENSVLKVQFESKLEAPEYDNQINMVALSYTAPAENGQDARVIMSNYARLFDSHYTDLNIGASETELFTQEANYAVKKFDVAYNGSLDLANEVVTLGKENGANHFEVVNNDALTDAGFSYEYALVNTANSDFNAFTIDKATGLLKAKEGTPNKYANVGKSALVRVTLKNAGKVATVGYFKVEISLPVEVLAKLTANDQVPYGCETDALSEVTFSNFNALTEHLAKAYQFNKVNVWRNSQNAAQVSNSNYAFEFETNADGTLKQYDVVEGKSATVSQHPKGNIHVDYDKQTLKVDGLTRADISTSKTYSTYVRVAKKDDPRQQLFVKVTWTPSKIAADPTTRFEGQPIGEAWKPSTTAGEQERRVHVNLTDKSFSEDLTAAFKTNTVKFAQENGVNTAGAKWVLITPNTTTVEGADGTKYDLRVDGEDKLQATTHPKNSSSVWKDVVKLDGSVVKYQQNAIADNILHKWSAGQMGKGQSFTARVAYQANLTCNPNQVAVRHAFDVRFIRPLNAKDVTSVTFVDGKKREDAANVSIKQMLSDFRDIQAKDADFWNLYGFTSVTIPVASEWTTTLGGGSKLSEVNDGNKLFELSIANATAGPNGYTINNLNDVRLKYVTKDAVISDFKVMIPVTFNYTWGKVTANIIVPVTKTATPAANARRK